MSANNGAAAGLRGTLPYDDEGTPTQDTPLIKEGILVGRLHSARRPRSSASGRRATRAPSRSGTHRSFA